MENEFSAYRLMLQYGQYVDRIIFAAYNNLKCKKGDMQHETRKCHGIQTWLYCSAGAYKKGNEYKAWQQNADSPGGRQTHP